MPLDRSDLYPLGAQVTTEQFTDQPYEVLEELCRNEPVSWLPALGGWMVSSRDLAVEAMRDDVRFTVDDPRFTTGAILGISMLNTEGEEHQKHRGLFAPSFRPGVLRRDFDDYLKAEVSSLLAGCDPSGTELRTQLAGPLAVNTITRFLGLEGVSSEQVLEWYHNIAKAITDLTVEGRVHDADQHAVNQMKHRVREAIDNDQAAEVLRSIKDSGALPPDVLGGAAVVLMFGAIETVEGMIANVLWHLCSTNSWRQVAADRSLLSNAIEESLRLEPAATFVDRYATTDAELGGVVIPAREKLSINLLAANRDPAHFENPHEFVIERPNAKQHVSFVQGPHGCIGNHLSRMETMAAIEGLLDRAPEIVFDAERSTSPEGLIFRKPENVWVSW